MKMIISIALLSMILAGCATEKAGHTGIMLIPIKGGNLSVHPLDDFYPVKARRQHLEGTAVIKICSHSDGPIYATLLMSTGSPLLDNAIIAWGSEGYMTQNAQGSCVSFKASFNLKKPVTKELALTPKHHIKYADLSYENRQAKIESCRYYVAIAGPTSLAKCIEGKMEEYNLYLDSINAP